MNRAGTVLQVSSRDMLGGAEGVALTLAAEFDRRGVPNVLAVGRRHSETGKTVLIPALADHQAVQRWLQALSSRSKNPTLRRILEILARPGAWLERILGRENFRSQGCRQFLQRIAPPRVLHCHNLHGEYFDLRTLPECSRRYPVVVHLHDMWLLTGHCSHSFGCARFEHGCGSCPDLTIPPSLRRDATAFNLRYKSQCLNQALVYAISPSRWLADQAKRSLFRPRLLRVIANGTDSEAFTPGCDRQARQRLGLPQDEPVIVFSARGATTNPFKDYPSIEGALRILSESEHFSQIHLVCLGSNESGTENQGKLIKHFVSFTPSTEKLNDYFRAGDLYLHAARAETFGKVLTEAMACGTPCVATAVGGIGEIVTDLDEAGAESATGLLTPAGDFRRLADACQRLLLNRALLKQLGDNARVDVLRRFTLKMQVDRVLDFYLEAEQDWEELRLRNGTRGPRVWPGAAV